jgi:hypothetical protein
MSRIDKTESRPDFFVCGHCGRTVAPSPSGHRNHCPSCLWSLHLDIRAGDRMSGCRGLMEPVGIWAREDGEWSILHRCKNCGFIRANRIAAEDNEMLLLAIAALPLGKLPFRLTCLESFAAPGPAGREAL